MSPKITKILCGITKIVFKLAFFGLIFFILFLSYLGIKNKLNEMGEKADRRVATKENYENRYPKEGDMVELNGANVVILKRYYWTTNRTYRVRMPNGSVTDVLGTELIDKEILTPIPRATVF